MMIFSYKFHTSSEWEVVRAIKERLCYVAFNPQVCPPAPYVDGHAGLKHPRIALGEAALSACGVSARGGARAEGVEQHLVELQAS